jgi:hypothetical protein
MAKKHKDYSSFRAVFDTGEPGKFLLIGIMHHMPDPIADLSSAVL